MSTYAYDELLGRIQLLAFEDQLGLLEDLASMIRQELTTQPKHSIMQLEGLGKEIWAGIDAQEYVNQERDSWDG